MPAASSKPTSQNLDSEAQDPVKLLIGALEKKARNLEKRKTKLETYKEMVNNGKSLNKDQEEAVSHYQEVQGNLNFAREFLGTIQTLINETSKAKKKHEKRESQQRQELEMQRIQDILLLQNILNHMGQDHIRNDFLAGTNGAEQLEEKDLTYLDEFYTIVNPSRESEEEGEETEKTEKKSFDEKMAEAAVHLDKFLKLDESEVCGTTYKYLKLLVQRIHKCGYLDNVPEPPAEEPEPPAPAPATAVVPEDEQDEQEDTENTEVEEDYSPSVVPASHTVVTNEVSGFSQSTQQQELAQPQVTDIPNPPEPIEMPPPKASYTHDVNDVLAPVQGGVTFLQESVVDVDSPHLDPAVVAVSLMPSQSYMSAAFQSTADSSSMDHQVTPSSQMDQSGDSLRQSSQTDNVYASQPDQVYSQNIYDSQQTLIGNTQQSMPGSQHDYTSQQNLPGSQHDFTSQQNMPANQHDFTSQQNLPATQHDYQSQQNLQSSQQSMGQPGLVSQQGYIDQTNFGSQAGMNTGPVGLGGSQPSLSSGPSQTDYSSSHQPLSGNTSQMDQSQSVGYNATGTQNMSDLRDFRNSPIDPQLTKPEDQQSSTSGNNYQSGPLPTANTQYTSSDLPPTDGFGQTLQGNSQISSDVSSMGTSGGNVTPPQSIPFPNEQSAATTQGLNKDSLEESTAPSSSLPKSTMNAAAPPFQSSARTSPHMQTIQGSTPEDPTFSQTSSLQQSTDDQMTVKKTDDVRSTEFRNSPPNLDGSYQYQTYSNNYSRSNRGNRGGRGGTMGSPGYRNTRGGGGGMPFIRNQPRFNNTNIQRGAYNPGYMPPPRDNFQPRTPDMGYTQGAAYNTFNRPQDQGYYRGRGGISRGAPRGGRGGTNIRGGQTQYRGRSGYQKPGTPITAI